MKIQPKSWSFTLVSGIRSVHRQLRHLNCCRLFLLLTCFSHMTICQSCDNPFGKFEAAISKIQNKFPGRDLATLLAFVRDSNPVAFRPLLDEWKRYTNCIGLVDTGYFKRSFNYDHFDDRQDVSDPLSKSWWSSQNPGTKDRKEAVKAEQGQKVNLLRLLMTEVSEM